MYERAGVEMPVEGHDIELFENPRGHQACQRKLSYRGPISPNVAVVRSPRIKLDLTADERLVLAMRLFTPADEMHRLAKRAMDNGAAQSRDEAEAMLRGYRVGLSMGPDEAADRHHQAALLTAVALGRRVFLGGVSVEGDLDTPLLTPLSFGATLRDAIVALGGPWAHRPMAPRFS